jgi:hypothetical protein
MGSAITGRRRSRLGTGCGTRRHTAAGLTQLRFTHEQVRYEPEYVTRILAQTASRLAIATK